MRSYTYDTIIQMNSLNITISRGGGPRGVGPPPPRTKGICSKNFENSQIQLFF